MWGFKLRTKGFFMRLIAMVVAMAMVICSVPVTAQASELQNELESHNYTWKDFSISYSETSSWSNYSVVDVNITNNSHKTCNGWKLEFDYDGTIDNIWNADILASDDGSYILISKDYNSVIESGQTVNIGFMAYGTESKPTLPDSIKVIMLDDSTLDDGNSTDDDNADIDNSQDDKEPPTTGSDTGIPEGLRALNYTVFSSNSDTLALYTNTTNIIGSVHTNSDFYYQGTKLLVDGALEACDGIKLMTSSGADCLDVASQADDAEYISMSYITTELSNYAQTEGTYYSDNAFFSDDKVYIDKPLYIDGGCQFNTTEFVGQGIVYATDSITYNVGNLTTVSDSRVFVVSENGNITLNGSDISINGVLYAPNGLVTINANSINIKGRIIADKIQINATSFNIEGTPHDFDVLDFVFEPEFDMELHGNQKVNRKITISLTGDDLYTKFISADVNWEIKKVTDDISIDNSSCYAIDESVSDGFYKELLFYESGTYDIIATLSNGSSQYSVTKQIVIGEDYAPEANLQLSEHYYLRDEAGVATINISDLSASLDGDILGMPEFSIYYDANNDGAYLDDEILSDLSIEPIEVEGSINSTYQFHTENVGKYKVIIKSTEAYEDTIPYLLKEDAYLSDTTLDLSDEACVFEVGNVAPEASINIEKAKAVDIVFTVGEVDSEKANYYADQIADFKEELSAQGIDARIEVTNSSMLTAKDTFAWKEYEHENYDEYPDHIIYEGDSIKMIGYTYTSYKDFLYVDETEPGTRIFEFDLQRDYTDWHSMDGGGFLFNAKVSDEENCIKGYCFLVSHGNLQIIKMADKDLDLFMTDYTYQWLYYRGDILASVPLENQYANHRIKLITDSNTATLYVDGELIIDELYLPYPAPGYGYGPIVSYLQHDCQQRSYFVFKDISMKAVSGTNLSDIIDGYDWRVGASHYVINLSDTEVLELGNDEKIAKVASTIIEDDVSFIGLGNDINENQYISLLNASGHDGIYIDSNSDTAITDAKQYIINSVLSKEYSLGEMILTDEMVAYSDYYKDYEQDEQYEALWEYEYDPAVFEGQGGTVEHIIKNQDEPITQFVDAGAYLIRLKVRDNPAGENDALDSYRLWSDTAQTERLVLVNNRPVADVNVTVSEHSSDSNLCLVDASYTAEDYDHPSDEHKGIREEYYWYKNIKDSEWSEGTIPTTIAIGETYLIKYQVKDVEGMLSVPAIGVVKTSDLRKYTGVVDEIPPEIFINISRTEVGVGDDVLIEAYAEDAYGLESFALYLNDELIADKYVKYRYNTIKAGQDIVKAVAIDAHGNENTVEIPINVVNDKDITPPVCEITSPNGDITDSHIEIYGTATDDMSFDRYTIEIKEETDEEYSIIMEGHKAVVDGLLGSIDLSQYKTGTYNILITVWDKAGQASYTGFGVVVDVNEEQEPGDSDDEDEPGIADDEVTDKPELDLEALDEPMIGVMNIGFTDITANIGGLNMSVNRRYDSRNKNSGDFGYGWSLDLQGLRLYELGNITTGYSIVQSGSAYSTGYEIIETEEHDVVVTYGDGTYDRFKLVMTPSRQALVPLQETTLSYTCVTNPNVKLEILCDTSAIIDDNSLGFYDDGMYDTLTYLLTTEEGIKLYIRSDIGLYKMVDISGNIVNIDKNGYHSEDGRSITFKRDYKGRIISATDPAGNTIGYEYDDKGNLVKVTDYASRTVEFQYDDKHNMLAIIDPSGIAVARNEYDENGKLIAIIDSDGNRIEYDRDIDGRTEAVRDRLGNTTVYVYDEDGNILSVTDPYGNTVTNTFDEDGNLLSTTDALGNTTTNTYDTLGNLTKTVAPDGTTVTLTYTQDTLISGMNYGKSSLVKYSYDDLGRLEAVTDAKYNQIVYDYSSDGRLTGISDSIGVFQQITYDEIGNVTSTTNGEGETAYYTYDDSGRVLSVTISREENGEKLEFTSYYSYNAAGDIVQSVDNAGNTIHYEYDINGNNTAVVDSKGRRFTYEYDTSGNMTKATYPDGTFELFAYDANDNNVSTTSRSGLTTEIAYDKLNRPVKMTYPDGTTEEYEYDANGNVISITDYSGATTTYTYDSCNRNTSITDAYGNTTKFSYDSFGKLIRITDAWGCYVQYEYDYNGNITNIGYQVGYYEYAQYDARNRMIMRADGFYNKSHYEYDDADRLIKVTDPYGNSYSYEYDPNGNLRSVTDPENHVTSYEYDEIGRLIKATNALGKTMEYTYDECGNLISSSDYSGVVTYYSYDLMDRLVEKKVGEDVTSYTYDDIGLLLSVTNKNGTVSYNYDDYNRLIAKTDERGVTISYGYDSIGRYTSINNGFEDTIYEYDLLGRLTSVTDCDGEKTTYEYNNIGDITYITYPNGIKLKYEYSLNHRLINEYVYDVSGNLLYRYYYYGFDANNNRNWVKEYDYTTGAEYNIKYEYDKLNRLTKETISCGEGSLVNEYTYDSLSNRTSKTTTITGDISLIADRDDELVDITEGTTEYTYNALNQLVTERRPEGDIIYTYDDNGSLIKVSGLKEAD